MTLSFILICSFFASNVAFAHRSSYGTMAHSMMGPMQAIISLLHIACMLAGIGMCLATIARFIDYRRNPSEVTLSTTIMQALAGLALIGLAFIPLIMPKH